ncbi:MAG: hypothetical protein GTO45_23670 [Candidatus Aminicenantes bacterium]|nr:hypothetical protein [Candidatus Aminicenantes bacterium]NIM81757.1 hypothetical protein [Candidatus Aminicenantes bacterium]NIN21129.1 hypothetical protein [Candidatus Aminicenantes bacterium]NIN44951.1 hypothetical protein [Candidatus Aminicenantes bacterium]NIN87765.1 hypothetical protein [Candidatus Aminicenantes bacterium]
MNESTIKHFDLDIERLKPLKKCMENFEIGKSNAEWPNNILSRKTVVWRAYLASSLKGGSGFLACPLFLLFLPGKLKKMIAIPSLSFQFFPV